jgi:protein TonB
MAGFPTGEPKSSPEPNPHGDDTLASSSAPLTYPLEAGANLRASGPPTAAAVRVVAEIVAITTQDDFLLELGDVLGGQAAVHPVESMALALEHMSASRLAHILAIDTRGATDLRDSVGRAFARAANAVIVLFANAADTESLREAFKGSKVAAVLPIPIDGAKTALVFAEALTDTLAKHSAPLIVPAAAASVAKSAVPSRTSRLGLPVGLAIGALALGATWFIAREHQRAVADARPPQVFKTLAQTRLVTGHIDELLEKARIAMSERRYAEPAADNALLYYRSAMAAEPGNAEALDGLARVAAAMLMRFDADLRESDFDAAAVTLANFRSAAPQDAESETLAARLTTARTRADSQRREEQARLNYAADLAAQRAREQDAAQRKAHERTAALAAAAKADEEKLALESARAADAAAKQAEKPLPSATVERPAQAPPQLKLTRYVTPEYPSSALSHNVGGSVIVGYTVDEHGATRDVQVLSAQPSGIFDRGAVEAVKQWRYAPVQVGGAAVAVPTRTTIKFAPH